MRVYLAHNTNPRGVKVVNEDRYPYILISYAYAILFEKMQYQPEALIIDSGAFTAWNQGTSIDFAAYRAFLDKTVPGYSCPVDVVNLDVIPGERGRSSTQEEREEGMARSLRNADVLRRDGWRVMEVYHQDEPLTFLDHLLARLRPGELLGLSPRNDVSVQRRVAWVQWCYGHFMRRDSIPPCHILAGTIPRMWESCPIYAADSTSWIGPARFGTGPGRDGRSVDLREVYPNSRRKEGQMVIMREAFQHYRSVNRSITTLWARRGITWAAPPSPVPAPKRERSAV